MGHDEVLPECAELKKQIVKHLEDHESRVLMLHSHEARLKSVDDYIQKQGNVRSAILIASCANIITILIASLGVAYSYGALNEKVNRLEKTINQYEFQK